MAILAVHPQKEDLRVAVWDGVRFETTTIRLPKVSGSYENMEEQLIAWLGLVHFTTEDLLCIVAGDSVQQFTISLAQRLGLPVYDIDPATPSECWPVYRVTGSPVLERTCMADTFVLKYLIRQEIAHRGPEGSEDQFIVAHLDGECQFGALRGLEFVDVLTSFDEGPFALHHSGGLPFDGVLDLCMAASSREEALYRLHAEGGLVGYLGLHNLDELWTSQHAEADSIREALIYQISKEIGALATVFDGKVTSIVLAGQLTTHEPFVEALRKRIGFVAPISIYPGNQVNQALLAGAQRMLDERSS